MGLSETASATGVLLLTRRDDNNPFIHSLHVGFFWWEGACRGELWLALRSTSTVSTTFEEPGKLPHRIKPTELSRARPSDGGASRARTSFGGVVISKSTRVDARGGLRSSIGRASLAGMLQVRPGRPVCSMSLSTSDILPQLRDRACQPRVAHVVAYLIVYFNLIYSLIYTCLNSIFHNSSLLVYKGTLLAVSFVECRALDRREDAARRAEPKPADPEDTSQATFNIT